MICNNSLCSKKGLSIIGIMLLSFVVSLTSIGLALFLNSLKPNPMVPVTTLISADYQMESAIVMQMQKFKNNPENEPKSFEKDILPGIHMTVNCSKTENNQWLFDASVTGRGINRHIKVLGHAQIPDKLIFLE